MDVTTPSEGVTSDSSLQGATEPGPNITQTMTEDFMMMPAIDFFGGGQLQTVNGDWWGDTFGDPADTLTPNGTFKSI